MASVLYEGGLASANDTASLTALPSTNDLLAVAEALRKKVRRGSKKVDDEFRLPVPVSQELLSCLDQKPPWKGEDAWAFVKQCFQADKNGDDPRSWNEQKTADAVGLDRTIDLAERCATFYVLEHLYNELFPISGWKYDGGRAAPDRSLPVDFGAGSRTERRAYAVKQALVDLEQKLADQFATYMILACGGELRHASVRGPDLPTVSMPNSFRCAHPRRSCRYPVHLYDSRGVSNQAKPGWNEMIRKASREQPDWSVICGHDCATSPGCFERLVQLSDAVPREMVAAYLEAVATMRAVAGARAGGWWAWWNMVRDDPVPWMVQCAHAFMHPMWFRDSAVYPNPYNQSTQYRFVNRTLYSKPDLMTTLVGYGGPLWATAAGVTADFLAGKISRRAFIDRCWSLQHNGGSIFNKLWSDSRTVTFGGETHNGLMGVLVLQSQNDYDNVVHFASDYVRGLWREHVVETGTHALTDAALWRPTFATERVPDHEDEDEEGESECVEHHWHCLMCGDAEEEHPVDVDDREEGGCTDNSMLVCCDCGAQTMV